MPLMTQQQARQLSALQLAFMGDTVCDLLTRSELMFTTLPVKQMHQSATQIVNARGAVFSGSKKQRPGFSDRCHDSVQDSRVP